MLLNWELVYFKGVDMVNERLAKKHLKENKDTKIDYVKVYNYTLKEQALKPLLDVKLENSETLASYVEQLHERIKFLEIETSTLRQRLKQVEATARKSEIVLEKIISEKLRLL